MNSTMFSKALILALVGITATAHADPAAPAPAVSTNAPIEEIDLSADDSAEAAALAPKVTAVADGVIDVSCDNATVASILQQFRRATRMNILNGDSTNLNRRVSASLNGVKWDDALKAILDLADFRIDKRGNAIYYVAEKTPEEVQNDTRYFPLKHASAVDLADLFNGVAMKTTYEERNSIRSLTTTKVPGLLNDNMSQGGSTDNNGKREFRSAIAGRAKATAYPNTNTLVLTGPSKNLDDCARIIEELDRPVTQVYIEARFIELSSQAMHKLGIQWNQLESWGATAKGINAGWENNNGKAADYGMVMTQRTANNNSTTSLNDTDSQNANSSSDGSTSATASKNGTSSSNKTTSDNATYAGLVPSSIAEAVGAGASAASMGWERASTFSGQLSADDFRLAISAFEQMNEGKLFSNPRIIVSNGKEAKVDMTQKEPNVEVTSSRSGTEGQSLDVSTKLETIPGTDKNMFAGEAFFSYGISLSVKPRVSSTGLISVEVVPTISEKTGEKNIAGASSDSIYTTYPIISIKSINTEFTMKDGATAVIGGLTQTTEQDVDSGIPYLRKIPWIGQKLFGWQSRQKVQTEILVCVTVGIANPETLHKDAGLPTNAVLGREYVEGRRFEPGNRPDAVRQLTTIDNRTLDDIREDPYMQKKRKEPIKSAVEDENVDLEK